MTVEMVNDEKIFFLSSEKMMMLTGFHEAKEFEGLVFQEIIEMITTGFCGHMMKKLSNFCERKTNDDDAYWFS